VFGCFDFIYIDIFDIDEMSNVFLSLSKWSQES